MINEDSFWAWHECNEPAEGKAMAIQSTVKFFTYLQESSLEEINESCNMIKIKIGLIPMLVNDKVKNDAVFSWIQENVPKDELTSTAFIDTLTHVVTESQINGGKLCDGFESRINILRCYINPPNLDLEIAALNALQHLMHKLEHPTSE